MAGVVLALIEPTAELGVALVVGSIFAGGSFVSQVWVLQVEREFHLDNETFGADQVRRFKALLRKHDRLAGQVEWLDSEYFAEHNHRPEA